MSDPLSKEAIAAVQRRATIEIEVAEATGNTVGDPLVPSTILALIARVEKLERVGRASKVYVLFGEADPQETFAELADAVRALDGDANG